MTVATMDQGSATLGSVDEAWSDAQTGLLEAMGTGTARTIYGWVGELTAKG